MLLLSTEMRIDVVRLFGRWLVVAAFVDGGDVGSKTIEWGDLHWAAGGGLRYRTVIGSIRADLGVRLNRLTAFEANGIPNPDPGQRFAFHLSLGEAF
jgi:outer membrane translocation and assembly module TamA